MDFKKFNEVSNEIVENTTEFLFGEIKLNCSLSEDIDETAILLAVSFIILINNLIYISEKKGISISKLYKSLSVGEAIMSMEAKL